MTPGSAKLVLDSDLSLTKKIKAGKTNLKYALYLLSVFFEKNLGMELSLHSSV